MFYGLTYTTQNFWKNLTFYIIVKKIIIKKKLFSYVICFYEFKWLDMFLIIKI